MQSTNTIVIGASVSGLATAACLSKAGIAYIIIEKQGEVVYPWRNHYDRLHLHTNKKLSGLPYLPFDKSLPKYPSREQVVDYMDRYREAFAIDPIFHTEAQRIYRKDERWIVETNNDTYQAEHVVMCTGPFGKPKKLNLPDIQQYSGAVTHSFGYKSGKVYKGQNVLVVGFGNSACEIAIDLYKQGAKPDLSVRSAVNVLPRDLLGIPILQLGLLTAKLPPKLVDQLNAPLVKLLVGDIEKLGLKRLPYGPVEQIHKHQSIPLLDIGTIKLIKEQKIGVQDGIASMSGKSITFKNGNTKDYDAIVAAIGYEKGLGQDLIDLPQDRFDDLKHSVDHQKYFGKDGIYFCGYWISPTGQFREIALDAKKIVADISKS